MKATASASAPRRKRNGETDRMKAVKAAADAVGLRLYRFNPTSPPFKRAGEWVMRRGSMNEAGVADFVGYAPGGRFVAVEVKDVGGVLRPEQSLFLDQVTQCGGIGFVAYGAEAVLALAAAAKVAGSWYALISPFKLPADTRVKLARQVELKRLKKA